MAVQSASTDGGDGRAALPGRLAKYTHPVYAKLETTWRKLRDVRSGEGGFADGGYLIGHPREYVQETREITEGGVTKTETVSTNRATKKLKARRALACYENFAATVVETLVAALFREQATRRVGDGGQSTPAPLEAWWDDVDGLGTHIDDFMAEAWDVAATFGHLFLSVDLPTHTAETAADQGQPFLRAYTPLDAIDWVVDDMGRLTAVKFAELAPRESIETAWVPKLRTRVVTATDWALYDHQGVRVAGGPHDYGRVPVVVLFAKRRPLDPFVGASVLGDPMLYVDLYNLTSEVRELLRSQTFSILNVPLGTGEQALSVEQAQAMMGNTSGTSNVLFSGAAAQFISADAANVAAYHEEIKRRLRTIYRLASLQWESDSQDAEAEGSLQLKREDMNQRLSAYADECERAEYALAELFYRVTLGGEAGARRFEADGVTVKYPDTFDMTPFDEMLEQAEAALSLGMPSAFLKELRKQLAPKFTGMGDLPEGTQQAIMEAIDAAPDDLTPTEQMQQRMDLTMQAIEAGTKKKPAVPKDGEKDLAA